MTLLSRFAPALCLACTLPLAAAAQGVTLTCSFTTECHEVEACAPAAFTATLGAGPAPGTVEMRHDTVTITGTTGGNDAEVLVWQGQSDTSAEILTWEADGTARLTIHMTRPAAMISYLGTCRAG